MNTAEEEPLTGARMYISEIAQKYNTLIGQEQREKADHKEIALNVGDPEDPMAKKKVDDLAVKVKQTLTQAKRDHEEQKQVF